MRGRFGFFGLLVIAVLALLVGSVAYNWGHAAGQTQVASPGTVVYVHQFGFGFGIFGFLFVLFFIGLLFRAFRPRHSGGGHGGWGHGGWGGRFDPNDPKVRDWMQRDVPPPFQPMLESWHRRAHGETGTGQPPQGAAGTPDGGTSGQAGA